MTEPQTASKRIDTRIPWLIVIPFVAVTLIWVWGFNQFKKEHAVGGTFTVGKEVETVQIITDVGNVDIVIGETGKIGFEGTALRATGSQELLDRAVAEEFTLTQVPSEDPKLLVLRASPLPKGFLRLPPKPGDENDQDSPRLFRQMNLRITVPAELALILDSSRGNLRVDTRRSPTTVKLGSGNLMVMHVTAPLTVRNGGGDTLIDQQRGPLNVRGNGLMRVTLSEIDGEVDIVNDKGEVHLFLPKHASAKLDAQSLTGRIRNTLGFKSEQKGSGEALKGLLGKGEYGVVVIAKAGTLNLMEQKTTN